MTIEAAIADQRTPRRESTRRVNAARPLPIRNAVPTSRRPRIAGSISSAAASPQTSHCANEIATALNSRPKLVASRTLDRLEWQNSTLIRGDVADEVAKLKMQEGEEIQVHGSGNLLQTLLQRDLVDTLRIWSFPVVLGTGKRLFGEGALPRSFQLVETQLNDTGAVLNVYERKGELRYGEVEVGQETALFDPDTSRR